MVKKLILIVRDYSYLSWLKKSNDPEYAWRQQKQMVIAFLIGWYFTLWTTLAMVSYKMGWHIFPSSKAHYLMKLIYGCLMFAPYVLFMWWWLDKLDDVPVDETSSYQKRGVITYSVLIMGILVAVLIPALLQEIIP